MGTDPFVVIAPFNDTPIYRRLMETLRTMLPEPVQIWSRVPEMENLACARVLFAVALDNGGLNMELFRLYERMHREPDLFEGSIAALCIAGESELYTKSTARELVFRANTAGCTFIGRCLMEATASLKNFELRARLMGTDPESAWRYHLRRLVQRLAQDSLPQPAETARLVVLYSTNRENQANTVRLWELIARGLDAGIVLRLFNVGKGQVYDCRGCSYERCHRLGCPENDLMTTTLHSEIEACDALMILAPNLNDSVGPDLAAVINRLTYLSNTGRIRQQALYAVIVSGYSGGDLLARQLLNALCLNKNFCLPAGFALMETANRPLSIMEVPEIQAKALDFADRMNKQLLAP